MIWLLGKINMCAVVPRKWSEGPQKGPEIDKLSSPLFPAVDDDVVTLLVLFDYVTVSKSHFAIITMNL